jgi:hypothetical protein
MRATTTPNILIGTPIAAGVVTTSYVKGLLDLQKRILQNGWSMTLVQVSLFLPTARNALATIFHQQSQFTHLLFIDSDMGFSPSLIMKMIEFNQPIVGAICPHRSVNFSRIAEKATKTLDPKKLERLSATYATAEIVKNEDDQILLQNGFVEVKELGTGIMLIRRDAIERVAGIPNIMVDDASAVLPSKKLIQCFMPLVNEKGVMMGEDLSFCQRWLGLGGRLWANIDEEIIHTGTHMVRGRFLDSLEAEGQAIAFT